MRLVPVVLGAALTVACGSDLHLSTLANDEPTATLGPNDETRSTARDAGDEPPAKTPPALDPSAATECPTTPVDCGEYTDARPDRLSEQGSAYDPERLELVIVGGTESIPVNCSGSSVYQADTWIFSDACNRWLQVPGTAPQTSGRQAMAWGAGKAWLFGGRAPGDSGAYTLFDTLYALDVGQRKWETRSRDANGPMARANSALVWDSSNSQLWLFGGNISTSGAAYIPLNDLWSFSPGTEQWTRHDSESDSSFSPPSPRLFHSMLYDSKRQQLIVFGGADEHAFEGEVQYNADLWSYDIELGQWHQLSQRGDGPDGRFWASLVYDDVQDEYILFGGHDDTVLGNRNDTWRYSPEQNTWRAVTLGDVYMTPSRGFCDFPPDFANLAPGLPERRNAHTMVWSTSCGHALLFGGKTDCGSADDVWQFSADVWSTRLAAREGEVCERWRDDPSRCADLCF